MISIVLGPRFVRTASRLHSETRQKIEATLCQLATQFGDPHRHSGLGVRKLAGGMWECRVDLHWRIVLIQEPNRFVAYDIMDHNELRAWLKSRR